MDNAFVTGLWGFGFLARGAALFGSGFVALQSFSIHSGRHETSLDPTIQENIFRGI